MLLVQLGINILGWTQQDVVGGALVQNFFVKRACGKFAASEFCRSSAVNIKIVPPHRTPPHPTQVNPHLLIILVKMSIKMYELDSIPKEVVA